MKKFLPAFLLPPLLLAVCPYFQGRPAREALWGTGLCAVSPRQAPAPPPGEPPYIVAVDPGHGGIDTGAESLVIETDVIDKTAEFLTEMLEADENFIPFVTRGKDEHPDSRQRAGRVKRAGRNLLISIHANSDSSPSSRGFECFPTPPGRACHRQSMRFAKLLAENMEKRGRKLRGSRGAPGVKFAYYSGNSKIIVDSGDTKIRSLQSFGILEKCGCPAALAEQCFVTNRRDVEMWTGDDGCRRAARAYYRAIKEYFGIR